MGNLLSLPKQSWIVHKSMKISGASHLMIMMMIQPIVRLSSKASIQILRGDRALWFSFDKGHHKLFGPKWTFFQVVKLSSIFVCDYPILFKPCCLQFQMRFATMDILMWYKALCWQLLILTYCPRDLLPNSVADQTKFKPLPFQATAPLVFCDLPHPIMNV